jgi:hypothetical protein
MPKQSKPPNEQQLVGQAEQPNINRRDAIKTVCFDPNYSSTNKAHNMINQISYSK